jgi:hypothetical protein
MGFSRFHGGTPAKAHDPALEAKAASCSYPLEIVIFFIQLSTL